jgi:hypothetical protein
VGGERELLTRELIRMTVYFRQACVIAAEGGSIVGGLVRSTGRTADEDAIDHGGA